MSTITLEASTTTSLSAPSPIRILVIDDQQLNIDMATRFLQQVGYEVISFLSGQQALAFLAREHVDAVLLDLMMPDMDGFETCKRVRTMEQHAELPILVVTGSNTEADVARAFAEGATDYINKPLRRTELTTRLRYALERRRTLADIRDLSAHLEQRVYNQTAALEATLTTLRQEIAERQQSELQLAHEHQFISAVLDNTVSAILTIDAHGTVRSFNRSAEKLFGYAAHEVIGCNVSMLMPEPHRTRHDNYVHNYLNIRSNREVAAVHRDGRELVVELAVSKMEVSGGPVFIGIVTDITSRRSMEKAIQQTRQRLIRQNQALSKLAAPLSSADESRQAPLDRLAHICRETLQSDLAVILVRQSEESPWASFSAGEIRDVGSLTEARASPSAADAADLAQNAMLVSIKSYRIAATPSDVTDDDASAWIENAVMVNQTLRGVVRCIRPASRSWHMDERHFVSFIAAQVALRLESDDRRRVKMQLRAHAARLKNAQRIARVGDWAWNPRTGEFLVSDALLQMVVPDGQRTIDSYSELLALVHPDDRIALSEATDASAIYGKPYDVDFRIVTPSGEELYVQGKGEPDPHDTERPARVTCTVLDVTARKRAEKELKDMRDNLQERVNEQTRDLINARDLALAGERAMSTFLANMSHEIRTPLHAVLSYARFGLNEEAQRAAGKANEYFQQILKSGGDLLELLNDLLDLSKLRAGRMVYEYGEVSLKKLLQDVIDRYGLLLQEHSLLALLKILGQERLVEADEHKLSQVIRNLLSNAIKFSPARSTIQLSVDFRADDKVIVAIADKGPGVPVAELESIFDPFVQGSHTKSNAGGTGLGLAICKEIVEVGHHGRIYARNNDKTGATFSIELPSKRDA